MTEKEFLAKFIDFIYYTENKSNWYLAIDNFLEAHHKRYAEVEFQEFVMFDGIKCVFDPAVPENEIHLKTSGGVTLGKVIDIEN